MLASRSAVRRSVTSVNESATPCGLVSPGARSGCELSESHTMRPSGSRTPRMTSLWARPVRSVSTAGSSSGGAGVPSSRTAAQRLSPSDRPTIASWSSPRMRSALALQAVIRPSASTSMTPSAIAETTDW